VGSFAIGQARANRAFRVQRLRSRLTPFKVACNPAVRRLQAKPHHAARYTQSMVALKEDGGDAMATERRREIKRRRKRRDKRLKARVREARRQKKKR